MYKKLLFICFIGSTLLFAENVNKEDMLKASIVKLINITDKLERRVHVLENKLQQQKTKQAYIQKFVYLPTGRKYKKMGVKTPSFFAPKHKSFIRVLPSPKANKVDIATSNKQYRITKIACYKDIGFWGKTQSGWIYTSNSKYGKLVNDKGHYLPKSYKYWCKK